jgi:hypothetical protein
MASGDKSFLEVKIMTPCPRARASLIKHIYPDEVEASASPVRNNQVLG